MKKKTKTIIISALFSIILVSCTYKKDQAVTETGFFFDTMIQVTVYDSSQQFAAKHCIEMAEQYEKTLSDTISDSEISNINSNPMKYIKVSPDTAELIRYGIKFGDTSEGRFDITIGKLADLWDFRSYSDETNRISSHLPEEDSIKKALASVDYRKILLKGNKICLNDPNAAIDLGGIAKGYIADKMKEYLKSENITSALINLGGNVLAVGSKPDGSPYTIGIQKPFSNDGTPMVSVDIKDKSVVTSGIYQRYFEYNEKIFHHIIDINTGYPCENELSSVTIIGSSSAECDALSTSVFLMGLQKGMDYVDSSNNIEAIFITRDNEIFYSSGMGSIIPYKEY